MSVSNRLALPFIDAAQALKHVTHNEALVDLDALMHLAIKARNVAAPPASPGEGDRYHVGAAATGAFAGRTGAIAAFDNGGWAFFAPRAGWRMFVEAEGLLLLFDGAAWNDLGQSLKALQNLSRLGVGATADATNPLSAKLNSALFAARPASEGGTGDLRLTLNKSASANTVSQLYQSNWSGRAETGLTGDDHYHVKVSADGAAWKEALNIDPATGRPSFPQGVGDGAPLSFRNRLRNAQFAINQRGLSGTVTLAAGQYGHDGVKGGAAGCIYTFATNGVDATLAISDGSLILPIEANLIEGGVYCLSQGGSAQARIWQGTGSAGAGFYGACPLVTGALAAATQTNVEFSTGTVLRPQFEPGAVATTFERRPLSVELALCQRYFETSYNLNVAPGTPSVGAPHARRLESTQSYHMLSIAFRVLKRGTPTITLYSNGASGASGFMYNQTAAADVAAAPAIWTQNGVVAQVSNVSLTAGTLLATAWAASSEI